MTVSIKVGSDLKAVTSVLSKVGGKLKVVATAGINVKGKNHQFWSAETVLVGKVKVTKSGDHWFAGLIGSTVPKIGPVSHIELIAVTGKEIKGLTNISSGKDFKYARIGLFIPTATTTIPDQTLVNVIVTVVFKGKSYPLHMSGRTYKERTEQRITITEQQSTKSEKEKNVANQLVKDISDAWAAGETGLELFVKSDLFKGELKGKGLTDVTADDARFIDITANTSKYDLFAEIGIPEEKKIKITVHSGISVRSDDHKIPAMFIGAQFAGKEIEIINNGSILGKEAGKDVGPAIKVQGGSVKLTNNGTIIGGSGTYTTKKVIKETYTQRDPVSGVKYAVNRTLFRTILPMKKSEVRINGKNITGVKNGILAKITHGGWTYVRGKKRATTRKMMMPQRIPMITVDYDFYRTKPAVRDKTIVETHKSQAPAIDGLKFITIVKAGTITGPQINY